MSIKFGVCTGLEKISDLIKAGYDYIELPLSKFAEMSEEEFQHSLELIKNSPVKAEAFNLFFKPETALVGKEFDLKEITAYSKKGLSRAAALGCKIAVIGSGKSRNIPVGFPYDEAFDQFVSVMKACGDIAGEYGIVIAIEPLSGTNFINTVEEGLELCRKVNHPNVKCLVDFYHVYKSGETLEAIENSNGLLVHAHIANGDRYMPESESDIENCRLWAQALKSCGYEGRISLEGKYRFDFKQDIERTREILSHYFDF